MADKNIIMKQKTASGYDNLYPMPSEHGDTHATTGSDPLPTGAVGADQIVNGSVGTAKLANGAATVQKGGTGKQTLTSNAVITGNGTNAVNEVSTANGALYATGSGNAPQFGTLPIAQGGTGATTAANARANLSVDEKGKITISGTVYTVRTGTAGADGYLTFVL